jgi:phytoene synthase
MVQKHSIEQAYQHCKEVTYHHAKTFYFASMFLAKEKRKACYAVYAFCRYVDDLVDNAPKESLTHDTIELVERWRNAIKSVYEGSEHSVLDNGTSLVMQAWADTLKHYAIPPNLPEELIEGVLMDTYLDRFNTFDELHTYCYKVASVVGLMTSEIFRYSHPDALPHAIDLGIAMQLTNICRDIAEDADRGRIYLPLEELKQFNVDPNDVLQKKFTTEFQSLMKFQVERANAYYDSADKGIAYLDTDSRLTVQLMSTNYRRILNKLVTMKYNPFIERAHLTFSEKLLAVPRAYLQTLTIKS